MNPLNPKVHQNKIFKFQFLLPKSTICLNYKRQLDDSFERDYHCLIITRTIYVNSIDIVYTFLQIFVPREKYKETIRLTNGQKNLREQRHVIGFSTANKFCACVELLGPAPRQSMLTIKLYSGPVQFHAQLQNQILSHPFNCFPCNSTKWAWNLT
jgi:hypothetical protein